MSKNIDCCYWEHSFDLSTPKDRKLKYEFSQLDGIIFGIKTKQEDKLNIIKIIGEKCRATGRKDFNFYQAVYSKEKGCINHIQMNLIKFSSESTNNTVGSTG